MERTTIRVPMATRKLLSQILRWSPSENVGRLVGDLAVNAAERIITDTKKAERMSKEAYDAIKAASIEVVRLERGRVTKESIE